MNFGLPQIYRKLYKLTGGGPLVRTDSLVKFGFMLRDLDFSVSE